MKNKWFFNSGFKIEDYGETKEDKIWKRVCIVLACIIVVLFFICVNFCRAESTMPQNMWQGLVAEDTNGIYQDYYVISCIIRNRLKKNMWYGIVAMKRKNLNKFVSKNVAYVKNKYNIDTEALSKKALLESATGRDITAGATFFEHTKQHPVPRWAKNMIKTKIFNKNKKNEITCYQ